MSNSVAGGRWLSHLYSLANELVEMIRSVEMVEAFKCLLIGLWRVGIALSDSFTLAEARMGMTRGVAITSAPR